MESISKSSKADGGSPTSIAFSNSTRRTSFSQSASFSLASRLLGSRLTTALKSFRASRWLRIAVLARARLQYAYYQSELSALLSLSHRYHLSLLISIPVNARKSKTYFDITWVKLQRLRSIHNGKPMRLEFNMRLYRLAFDHPSTCSHPSETRIRIAYLSAIAEVRRLLVIFLNRLCVKIHSGRPFVLSEGFVSLHLECVGGLDVRHARRGVVRRGHKTGLDRAME